MEEVILKRYRALKASIPIIEKAETLLERLREYERVVNDPEITNLRSFLDNEIHNRVWYYVARNRPIPGSEVRRLDISVEYVEDRIRKLKSKKALSRKDEQKYEREPRSKIERSRKKETLLGTFDYSLSVRVDLKDLGESIVRILRKHPYGLKAKQIARELGLESGLRIGWYLRELREKRVVDFDGKRWRLIAKDVEL